MLIVENDSSFARFLFDVAHDHGFKAVVTSRGAAAIKLASELRPAAVQLLDVNMPDMDCFETALLIRQHRNSLHTPIIFVTTFGDEMHAARDYSLGAVDYMLAPVLPDVLRTKVAVFRSWRPRH